MSSNKEVFAMHKRNGFTLAELLIVVAIVAVLVSISIPVFTSKIEKAKEVTCLSNRRSLYSKMSVGYMTGEYDSLSAAFTALYTSDEYPCPSGGTYKWNDDGNGYGHITCSIHGGSGSGSSSEATYGNTGIKLQKSYWPHQSEFAYSYSTVNVSAGGIFQYTDGNYYVINKSADITKSQAASGPGGDLYNWFYTQKLTGTVVTYSSNSEQKSTLKRGDLCKVGNDYYVFINGGSWAYDPSVEPNSWYKLPN